MGVALLFQHGLVLSDDFIFRAASDLDSVGDLCRATVECEVCGKREVIDQQVKYFSAEAQTVKISIVFLKNITKEFDILVIKLPPGGP